MNETDCLHEREVAEAMTAGRWPNGCDPIVVAHADSCASCSEIVTIGGCIYDAAEQDRMDARVPPAGLVWWRAQLRARRELADAADRRITLVQVVAAAVAGGFCFTLGGLLWPWLRASITLVDRMTLAAEVGRFWVPLVVGAGAWLVLAPILLLLVLSDE